MNARDIMTPNVISLGPEATVDAAANTMACNRISAVPIIDIASNLVGIVSEGDLLRRSELGSERRRSWWLDLFASSGQVATDFVKARAVKVKDVMTTPVRTVMPDTSLDQIADVLESHGIKRVPVVEAGRVIGIVSRANLIQALAALRERDLDIDRDDVSLREAVMRTLQASPCAGRQLNVVVRNREVDLWGLVRTAEEKQVVRVAAESTPGIERVKDHLQVEPGIMSKMADALDASFDRY